MEKVIEELAESFINGNMGYVVQEIGKYDSRMSAYVAAAVHARLVSLGFHRVADRFVFSLLSNAS